MEYKRKYARVSHAFERLYPEIQVKQMMRYEAVFYELANDYTGKTQSEYDAYKAKAKNAYKESIEWKNAQDEFIRDAKMARTKTKKPLKKQ